MKNFLILFSSGIIILSAMNSSAFIKTDDSRRKDNFMQKFEQTYKFSAETEKKAPKSQQFLELFEKVMKK